MFKKTLACSLAILSLTANLAHAGEAEIRKAVTALFGPGIKVDAVRKAEVLNLYEVRIGNDILYSDEKGAYFIQGDIIDVNAHQNLTEVRKNKLAQIKFSDLPLELAVKTVRGNGKRIFATFEDPNCGYCKKLAKDMVGMTDYTVYTFLYPILSADSGEKAKAIWCSTDRAKAWNEWMINGTAPSAASCATPTDKVVALGQKLSVHGTPTIFLTNGERIPGALPAAQLEQALNRVASAR
ncbi:MAG: DsbC family protein [Betaproteobacteria bacterium]|nr:DsbC family protein [Betaproteobacteria bacterium]